MKAPKIEFKVVKISEIKISDRAREDLGDLQELAELIKANGPIQAVVLDGELNLLAGERRLRAAALAGLTDFPALIRKNLTELEKKEIEFSENQGRKDFTWKERAGLIHRIDKLSKEKDPLWTSKKTAELLGIGEASVSRSLKLTSAVQMIPGLASMESAEQALQALSNLTTYAETSCPSSVIPEEIVPTELPKKVPTEKEIQNITERILKHGEKCFKVESRFNALTEFKNKKVNFLFWDLSFPQISVELVDRLLNTETSPPSILLIRESQIPFSILKDFAHSGYNVAAANPIIWAKEEAKNRVGCALASKYEFFFILSRQEPQLARGVSSRNCPDLLYFPPEKILPGKDLPPILFIQQLFLYFLPDGGNALWVGTGASNFLRACNFAGVNGIAIGSAEEKTVFLNKLKKDIPFLFSTQDTPGKFPIE